MLQRVIYPVYPEIYPARIYIKLISLKYYYNSPRAKNKAISKQPTNPTGQVPQIQQGVKKRQKKKRKKRPTHTL